MAYEQPALPPGLAGYQAAVQGNQQQSMGQLQQMQLAMGLQGEIQKQNQAQGFRQAVAGLGPNPDQEALVQVAAKFGNPADVLKTQQASADRKAAMEQKATEAQARLDSAKQNAEMAHEFRMSRLTADQDRAAESARHNKAMEGLNAQNAQLANQMKMMGLDIQRERGQRQEADNSDKAIEKQINTTANRLKDVQPVMVAARQLNDLMSQYTPDTIPGVGYAKNTDTGKMFLSPEGKDVSSSIKLVGNSILKAMSGTAVTAPEEVRQMAAQMADGRYSAKDFYIAWPKVSEWLNTQSKVAQAGLTDPARERFAQRTGLNLDPINPRFTVDYQGGQMSLKDSAMGGGEGAAKKVSSQAEYMALPSGATYIAPDGSTRKKK